MRETLELLYEVKDRIATLTLNRPDKLNTGRPVSPNSFEAWRCSRSHVALVHRELQSEPQV
jgi:1,4-dihydroxy-2-naphthoyl-CoA synthase